MTLAHRKRAKPHRIRSPRCDVRGCEQITRVVLGDAGAPAGAPIGYCIKHARAKADRLWSAKVRKGYCELAGWHRMLGVQCGGPIVACHGIGRTYGATRYVLANGFSGCSGINNWTESHPLEWEGFLRERWGVVGYENMRRVALDPDYRPDWVEIIERLTCRKLANTMREPVHGRR